MIVPQRCVLDTNICIKQFIIDPLTPKVNELFDSLEEPSVEFFVPDLFYIECANVLWKYVRANLYTAEQVQADLSDLKALRFHITSTKALMGKAVEIGLEYGITAYDGCYVALSEQVIAPLLTLDERLANSLKGSKFDVQLLTDFIEPT
jgi:predicted nucleic acid-binding protein